jgi:acetyl-CoA carboxylase carboxyl transferase subunit beta
MNWITNFVRPKIRALVTQKTEVPDNLWIKCGGCGAMLFHRELEKNLHVCHHCGHHLRLGIDERLTQLFDGGAFESHPLPAVPLDPLKFKDQKRYADRLKAAQTKTGQRDGLRIASGKIGGKNVVVAGFDFDFMGGSMGIAVGSGIVHAGEIALKNKAALIVIPASGGARMQEGILSLMQMPRTTIAVQRMREAGLPYIVLLTDPTTGGVSASFAMLGDLHIAEPGAMIGFAGKRVIEETIRQKLPDDFQTAEYLLAHGMVDCVIARKDQPEAIGKILGVLMK